MKETTIPLDEWRKLYDAAAQLRPLAPWRWIDEQHLVAVEDPVTGTPFYCSILGAADEVLGVAAYVGATGLESFRRLLDQNPLAPSLDALYRQHVYTTFFVDRHELESEELSILRKLHFSAKGDRPWPQFLCYEPGRPPMPPTIEHVRQLTLVLEQVVDVVERAESDRSLLERRSDGSFITRVADRDADGAIDGWHDEWRVPAEPKPGGVEKAAVIEIEWQQIARAVGRRAGVWEVGVMVLPVQITHDPGGPFIPYASIVVDIESGNVLDVEVTHQEEAYAVLPGLVARSVARLQEKPIEIHVETEEAAMSLRVISRLFGTDLVKRQELVAFHAARLGLEGHMQGESLLDPAMLEDDPEIVPPLLSDALADRLTEIIELTDRFCREHLDEEYARLCRRLAIELAELDPSPLERGRIDIWACAITYAIGSLNFLFDQSQTPHMRATDLCRLQGISSSTASAKATVILDTLAIAPSDPNYTRQPLIDSNPLAWIVTIEGVPIDARELPEAYQSMLHEEGAIPRPPWEILLEELESRSPFAMLPSPEMAAILANQGTPVDPDLPLTVTDVRFAGDEAGIIGIIELQKEGRVIVVPLTTLKPLPDDPLADRICQYNERRVASFETAAYLDQLAAQRMAARRHRTGGNKPKGKPKGKGKKKR